MKTKSGATGRKLSDDYFDAINAQLLRKKDHSGCMNSWVDYKPPQAYADQLKRCAEFRAVPSLKPQIQGVGK